MKRSVAKKSGFRGDVSFGLHKELTNLNVAFNTSMMQRSVI
jgi:hypothetical protein